MRILGSLDQPGLKTTVFQTEGRLLLKLENEQYEQTFKLRSGGQVETLEDVRRLLDPEFLEAVQTGFQSMHRARLAAFARAFPPLEADEFDVII